MYFAMHPATWFATNRFRWYHSHMVNGKLARLLLTCMTIGLVAATTLLFATLTSCSRNPDGDVVGGTEEIPIGERELPDMVLSEAKYTMGRPGESALVLQARTMTVYKDSKGTVLEDVVFRQEGEGGLEGSCESATIDEKGEKATLSGNVRIKSANEDLTIEAQDVEWDNGAMTIKADGEVSIEYGDGTKVLAEGFSAVLDEDDFEFGRIIRGTIE